MKMRKTMGFWTVFSIAAGAMISSGIFILPAIVYQKAGNTILWAYFFAGVMMIPALFSQLELSSAIPKAGGSYFFAERIIGTSMGVVTGFANWFSIALKSAFALAGIGVFATLIFPQLTETQIKLIAVAGCVIFTLTNIVSVEASGKLEVILVIFLLLILLQFVIIGRPLVNYDHFSGFLKPDWLKLFSVTGAVFISYGGLTQVASIAEEVKNPEKNLVRGAIAAFVIVQLLYLLVVYILIGVIPPEVFAHTLTPVSTAGLYFSKNSSLGEVELILTATAAMLAFITTANAGLMAASRSPLGMSRDGLLPESIGRLSKKKGIPVISVLITSGFMIIVIMALNLESLAKVASLFMLMIFLVLNISVIVMRRSGLAHYRPAFKVPGYPWMNVAGIIAYLFLIATLGVLPLILGSVFIVLSLLWYFLYARKRVVRKSALAHMIERIADPELHLEQDEQELEKEFLDILIERENIIEDRFDKLIREAMVLDYPTKMIREEFFTDLSRVVSKEWNLNREKLFQKLESREAESQTLIYPGIAVPHAIPHVIIEGEHSFHIILVRCKKGIVWNSEGEKVFTAFCLLGTKDERNFHLKTLMAIAQVLQDAHFHEEWMKARNTKEMRGVILLSRRKR